MTIKPDNEHKVLDFSEQAESAPEYTFFVCARSKKLYSMVKSAKSFDDVHAALVLADIWDPLIVTVLECDAISQFFEDIRDLLERANKWDAVYSKIGSAKEPLVVKNGDGELVFSECAATGTKAGFIEYICDAERVLADNLFEVDAAHSPSRLETIARWTIADEIPCEVRSIAPDRKFMSGPGGADVEMAVIEGLRRAGDNGATISELTYAIRPMRRLPKQMRIETLSNLEADGLIESVPMQMGTRYYLRPPARQ